ncbi:Uncharacterised protein [Mycobacteroides abscessus subsp. massiliense]|nr:Uncharacterised protein [Mycobacteroides abscessus subsp. massiliense]
MAQPVGTTEGDRLVDRGQSKPLTGVDGEPGVGITHVLEGIEVAARRIARLGSGDVEPDGTPIAEGQAGIDVQLGSEAHLGVHHAIGREVLHALGGHAVQRRRRLHHTHGVREGLQVLLQRATVRGGTEPRSQGTLVLGRQALVPRFPGQVQDGAGPQPPVEMVMQKRLGSLGD